MAINFGAIGKRVGGAVKAGGKALAGDSDSTSSGASELGSMLRTGITKYRNRKRKSKGNGNGKPSFKYRGTGKTMSA